MGAPCFRAGFCSKTIIPDSEEHPLASSRAVPKDVLRWIRVKTIAQIAAGNPAPQGETYFSNGQFPFVRTSDVGAVHRSDHFVGTADRVNQEAVDELGLRLFPTSTILFPKSGASTFLNHRVVLGELAYVASHLAGIICNEKKVSAKYVYRLLCQIDARSITPDQAYPSLRLTEIGNIKIPLPPLEVQREIVAEIEDYQKVIDGARAVVENYRPHIVVDPEWTIVKLEDFCTIVRGSSPRPKGDSRYYGGSIPRLMVADITRDGMYATPQIDSLTAEGATKSRPMNKGDVIITVSGNPGLPTILVVDACIHDGFVGLREIHDNVNREYLYWILLSQHQTNGLQSVGAIFKNLTTHQIKEFKIPLPPLIIQQAIVAEIETEQSLVAANRELIGRLEKKIRAAIARVWEERLDQG